MFIPTHNSTTSIQLLLILFSLSVHFFFKLDKANKPTQIVNIKNRFNIHSQNQFVTFNSSSFSNESPSQRYWEIFKRLNEGTYTQAVPNLESR